GRGLSGLIRSSRPANGSPSTYRTFQEGRGISSRLLSGSTLDDHRRRPHHRAINQIQTLASISPATPRAAELAEDHLGVDEAFWAADARVRRMERTHHERPTACALCCVPNVAMPSAPCWSGGHSVRDGPPRAAAAPAD